MRKENSYLTKRLEEMGAVQNKQEQYSSRNWLLIHEINEEKVEDNNELSIKANRRTYKSNLKTLIGYIDLEVQKNL